MTTTPSRPNFFILLGLNPDAIWNQTLFESALRTKQNEWARQGASTAQKALIAKQNLALIPKIKEVMNDQALREKEATAARVELAAGRKAREEQFDKQLAFINAKDFVAQAEIDKFIDDFKDIFSAQEIKKRIRVKIAAPSTSSTGKTHTLDASLAKNIKDRLDILHMSTLYELLNPPGEKGATTDLHGAANKLYSDMVSRPPTTEWTAKSELAGFAMTIFKSDKTRDSYDENLRQATLRRILKDFDESMSRSVDKEVHQRQAQLFLEEARKEGWSEQEALEKLKDHARLRKWIMVAPAIDPSTQKICCGSCKHLNDKAQLKCTNCGLALFIDCPDCGKSVSCEFRACGNCGFPIGNRYGVDTLLEELANLLKTGDLKRAKEVVDEAEILWRPSKSDQRAQKIAQHKAELKRLTGKIQKEQKATIGEIRKLTDQKQFFAARHLLATRGADLPNHAVQQRAVDTTIAQAQDLVKRALMPSVSQDNKIELYRQALVLCADYKDAQELLKTMSPSAPSNLQVTVRGTVVSLAWDASSTRGITYKILCKSHAQPNSPTDGTMLDVVTGLTYDDIAPEIGVPLYYAVFAVFAVLDSTSSSTAALLAQSVLLVQDVLQATVQVDDQRVTISWEPPPHVHTVVIIRKEQTAPSSLFDGMRVAELDLAQKRFVDQSVQNEQIYHYGIYCQFKDADKRLVTSSGTSVHARPEIPPGPISHIDIAETGTTANREVHLSWQSPSKGTVIILKSQQSLQQEGKVLPEVRLGQLGQRLDTHSSTVTDIWAQSGVAYYTPVVLFQQMAYMGPSHRYACVENVSNLRYQNLGTALRLQWTWPENCLEVRISYSSENWPQLNDPKATTRRLSRAEYDHLGYYDIRGTINHDYYIIVFVVVQQGNELLTAQGVRLHAQLVSRTVLTYEIKNLTMLRKRRTLHITTDTTDTQRSLPTLLLVSQCGQLPFRKTDGDIFWRIEPMLVGGRDVIVNLPATILPARTFGKLFLEDDSLHSEFTIHHPHMDKLRLS